MAKEIVVLCAIDLESKLRNTASYFRIAKKITNVLANNSSTPMHLRFDSVLMNCVCTELSPGFSGTPVLVEPPVPQELIKGQLLHLKCFVRSIPSAVVTWHRDEVQLIEGARIGIRYASVSVKPSANIHCLFCHLQAFSNFVTEMEARSC